MNELRSFFKAAGASRCSAYQSGSDSSSSSVPNPVSGSSTSDCISGSSGGSSSPSGSFGSRGIPPVFSVTPPTPLAPPALVPLPASPCGPRVPRVAVNGSHRPFIPPPVAAAWGVSSSGSSRFRGMSSDICRDSPDATCSSDPSSVPSVPMRTAGSSSCGEWLSSPFIPPPVAAARGMSPPAPAAGCQVTACRQMMSPVVRSRTRKVPRGR